MAVLGTHIVENNEGSVDAADCVVADPGRDLVRGNSWVAHGGKCLCAAGIPIIIDAKLESSSGGPGESARRV